MKKQLLTLIILFLSSISIALQAQSADAIVGKWLTTDKDGHIEIFKEGGKYFGKIVWMQDALENGKPKLDKNNTDKAKRNQPILGMRLLRNFEHKGSTWENGTIYDPTNGKTYSCIIKKKNDKTLEVRGFVGFSMIGRTVEWTKVE